MENSGDSARDSARDSGDLRGELRNSGDSDHSFWRTQGRTQGAPPLGLVTELSNTTSGQRPDNALGKVVAK